MFHCSVFKVLVASANDILSYLALFVNNFFHLFYQTLQTEKEGFEPSRRVNDLLPFQGSPFSRLGTSPSCYLVLCNIKAITKPPLVVLKRRRWDSNPRPLSESLVFKTSSLNHSDTSPYNSAITYSPRQSPTKYHRPSMA